MVKARKLNSSPRNSSSDFFKVYLPDLSSQRLRIPPAFIKHFKGVIPDMTMLRSRSRLWFVELQEVENNFFFQSGWQDFVEDYPLETGDFLLFSYICNSGFDVKVFAKTGCEKEDSLACSTREKTPSNIRKKEQPKARKTFCKSTHGSKRRYNLRSSENIYRADCLHEASGFTRCKTTVPIKVEDKSQAVESIELKNPHCLRNSKDRLHDVSGCTQPKRTVPVNVEDKSKPAKFVELKVPHYLRIIDSSAVLKNPHCLRSSKNSCRTDCGCTRPKRTVPFEVEEESKAAESVELKNPHFTESVRPTSPHILRVRKDHLEDEPILVEESAEEIRPLKSVRWEDVTWKLKASMDGSCWLDLDEEVSSKFSSASSSLHSSPQATEDPAANFSEDDQDIEVLSDLAVSGKGKEVVESPKTSGKKLLRRELRYLRWGFNYKGTKGKTNTERECRSWRRKGWWW